MARVASWHNYLTGRVDVRETPSPEEAHRYVPNCEPCQRMLQVCLAAGDDVPTAMVHALTHHVSDHGRKELS